MYVHMYLFEFGDLLAVVVKLFGEFLLGGRVLSLYSLLTPSNELDTLLQVPLVPLQMENLCLQGSVGNERGARSESSR